MKNRQRSLYIIVASAVLCAVMTLSSLSVFAASPTYNMSSDYKGGKYYDNFRAVDLVGDGVRDTLAIALSQLGYHEGNDNAGRDGLSVDGDRDFVEYNVLYGKLDNNQGNGISYGYYWCASFVNWCLRSAEVSREASAAAEVSCRRWLSACKSSGIYNEKEGYIPKSADIIFFKERESQLSSTHIGLVLYCEGDTVYTIEGNTSNGSEFSTNGNYVALKSYKLSSSYIVGYATPKYKTAENIGEIDYSGKTFSAGKYISTDKIKIYSDNKFDTEVGKIDAFTVFKVDKVEGNALYVSGGVVKAESVKQITARSDIRSVSYLDTRGKKIYENTYAKVGDTINITDEIPERSDAAFLGWAIIGGDELLSPGDEVTIDKNIELYAIYDDTSSLPTEKASEAISHEMTEPMTEATAKASEEISEKTSTENSSEFLTEDLSVATESAESEVASESDSDKTLPLPALSNMINCSSTLSAGASAALMLSIAASGMIFKKKTDKKDKK